MPHKIGFSLPFNVARVDKPRTRIMFHVTLPDNPAEIERLLTLACRMVLQDHIIAKRPSADNAIAGVDPAIQAIEEKFGWVIKKA